jgi:cell division protein FtsB
VRPANRRSGGTGSGAATRTAAPRPRRRVTGRAVVLGVVLVALALSYVFPLRVYIGQQAEISQLRADQQEQQARIDRLTAGAALWSDGNYIRIQARQRLYFGEPGEMLLLPVWEEDQPPPPAGADPEPPPAPPAPWWDSLWTSLEAANRAGGGEAG